MSVTSMPPLVYPSSRFVNKLNCFSETFDDEVLIFKDSFIIVDDIQELITSRQDSQVGVLTFDFFPPIQMSSSSHVSQ